MRLWVGQVGGLEWWIGGKGRTCEAEVEACEEHEGFEDDHAEGAREDCGDDVPEVGLLELDGGDDGRVACFFAEALGAVFEDRRAVRLGEEEEQRP